LSGWRCQTAPFAWRMRASCVAGVRAVALGGRVVTWRYWIAMSCFALYIAWDLFSLGEWMRIRPCVGVGAGQCRSRFRVHRVGRSVHPSISVCLLKGCLTLGIVPAHWRCEATRRFCSLLRCRVARCAPPGPALWARRVRALHACAALIPCLVASVGVVRSRGTRPCAKDARRVLGGCSTDD
jgi:hypothetical protein